MTAAAVAGPTPYSAANSTMPGQDAFAISVSNTTPLPAMARAIYVGVGGDITLITSKGNTVLFTGVLQGAILPVMAIQVKATGTTASSLVAIV